QTDYSTIFYFNLGMSVVLYSILFISAPLIAEFYRMPVLCKILRVQGLVLFIYSFNIIQQNIIRKNLQFKKLSKITITTSVVSLVVTVVLAYEGWGVWALVVQNFLIALVPCVFFWITTDWHPTLEYSWKSLRELFSFGSFMFLTHLFETFSNKISVLLIGRWFNSATMGYYSRAESTANLASLRVAGVMISTTYPLYASVQDDKERLANIIKRITSTLAYVTYPILFILILIAKPLFVLLFSEKWTPCVPYFQMLCLAGLATCLQAVNYQSIAAIGKSRIRFYWTIVNQTVAFTLQLCGVVFWGMKGLLIGMVISCWFAYIVNISLVSKYVGYKNYQQLLTLGPILLVAGISSLVAYFIITPFGFNIYLDAALKFFITTTLYLGWSVIFKPEAYTYTLSIVKSQINKK
ncbi:MAG: lipopolysaccharide biosynthesis protein, partial [Aeriscardovia sp.]|nr:lipopolysaccharide biosynthesis protein [Aeriscardovia sp.]